MNVAIIGLGLMGGSLAKDLRKIKFASTIIGVDNNQEHQKLALKLGLVDRCLKLNQAIQEADLIVLAIPVDVSALLLTQILNLISDQQPFRRHLNFYRLEKSSILKLLVPYP